MDKQIHPPTVPLLITEYYDSLIRELDIYTEERINYYAENSLPQINVITSDAETIGNKSETTYGVLSFENPYESDKYTAFGQRYFTEKPDKMGPTEYLNMVREKAIEEIRKAQEENLQYYRDNIEKFKVYRENLINQDEEKIEELRSNLFANRFCFLVYVEKIERTWTNEKFLNWQRLQRYLSLFNLHLVITDFYLAQSDIDLIRKEFDYKYCNQSTKLNQRYLLGNQVRKYIKELCYEYNNGFEIIRIKQKTLLQIKHIECDLCDLRFSIDFSSIRSLKLSNSSNASVCDLSAFVDLEYLFLSGFKLCGSPFQKLRKLIKIKLHCDLTEFDVNSLNSLTSLEIIEMRSNENSNMAPFKIDMNRLINLKWLDISMLQETHRFEIISNRSKNRLTKLKLSYTNKNNTIDFFKRLCLPQLKCLDISNIDLSQQIKPKWFIGKCNLIELNLNHTELSNVDFLNTDLLNNVEILSLAYNKLGKLRKGVFSKLTKLKNLDLKRSQIELVSDTFEGLKCLELVDIRQNHLDSKSFDKTLFVGLDHLIQIKDFPFLRSKPNYLII